MNTSEAEHTYILILFHLGIYGKAVQVLDGLQGWGVRLSCSNPVIAGSYTGARM